MNPGSPRFSFRFPRLPLRLSSGFVLFGAAHCSGVTGSSRLVPIRGCSPHPFSSVFGVVFGFRPGAERFLTWLSTVRFGSLFLRGGWVPTRFYLDGFGGSFAVRLL